MTSYKNVLLTAVTAIVVFSILFLTNPEKSKLSGSEFKSEYNITYETLDSFKDVDDRYEIVWKLQSEAEIEYESGNRYAFSYDKGDKCVIVIAKASNFSQDQYEKTLGHEHLHCMYGAWH